MDLGLLAKMVVLGDLIECHVDPPLLIHAITFDLNAFDASLEAPTWK